MSDDTITNNLKKAYNAMNESETTSATAKKFSVKDDNSKEVTPVSRESGASAGAKEVGEDHGSKKPVEGAKPVGRSEGSTAGEKEVGEDHGSKKPVEGAKPVGRTEGSGSAPKAYSEFRGKVRNILGLSDMTKSELNKPNNGLNK